MRCRVCDFAFDWCNARGDIEIVLRERPQMNRNDGRPPGIEQGLKPEGKALRKAVPNPSDPQTPATCTPYSPLNIVLVDDRQLFRESLRALILSVDSYLTVTEAGSPTEVPQLIQDMDFSSVIFANIVGTESERLPWLDHFSDSLPSVPVGVLTEIDDVDTVRAMLDKGVRGMISPVTPGTVLVGALRILAVGGTYIPASLLWGSLAGESDTAAEVERSILNAFSSLSNRQAAVLRLIADSLTNQQIAETLQICPSTVKVHVHNIFERLQVHRRAEARRLVEHAVDANAANP